MGMLDREYMRRREEAPPDLDGVLKDRWLWIGMGMLAVVGLAIVLLVSAPQPRQLEEGSRIVNINSASAVELESLPGIGPSLAQLIIAGRPYRKVDEIEKVVGIGPRQVEQLRPLLTVSGATRGVQDATTWNRVVDGFERVDGLVLSLIGLALLVGLYFLFRLIHGRIQDRRVRRAQALFDEAERRRWEGHRRER